MKHRSPPRRAGGPVLPAPLRPLSNALDHVDTRSPLKRRRGSSVDAVTLKPEFITIAETAAFWRCSRRKVERKLRNKVIPKFKDGHRTLLRISDVRAHARKMRQK